MKALNLISYLALRIPYEPYHFFFFLTMENRTASQLPLTVVTAFSWVVITLEPVPADHRGVKENARSTGDVVCTVSILLRICCVICFDLLL